MLALKKGRFALCDEPKTFSRLALWTSPWRFVEVFNFPQAQSSPELFRIMVRFIPYVMLRVSFKKLLASGMVWHLGQNFTPISARFPFLEYCLQECAIGRESRTLDLLVPESEDAS